MNKIYCVYEKYTKDFMVLNNIEENIKIIKVFDDIKRAMQFVKNELSFQCNNDNEWEYAVAEEKNDEIIFEVYYAREVQYRVIIKEMELN